MRRIIFYIYILCVSYGLLITQSLITSFDNKNNSKQMNNSLILIYFFSPFPKTVFWNWYTKRQTKHFTPVFDYKITFVILQHKSTNSKGDFVLKKWFETFVLKISDYRRFFFFLIFQNKFLLFVWSEPLICGAQEL